MEIIELSNKIKQSTDDYNARFVSMKLGFIKWDSGWAEDKNAIADAHNLPQKIILSPEMASFLFKDQNTFDAKHNALYKTHHPWKEAMAAPTNVLISLIYPPHSTQAIASVARGISKYKTYQAEYEKIWQDRDQTIGTILSRYRLTKDGDDYVLQRANWTRYTSSNAGFYNLQDQTGIDDTIKNGGNDLPDLPSPTSEKGRGR
jgi:hypothetical protein